MTTLLPEIEDQAGCLIEPRNPNSSRRLGERRTSTSRCPRLPVRYLSDSHGEASGILKDICLDSMQITTLVRPAIGSSVIVYIDRIGRFESEVTHLCEGGVTLKIIASASKRARMKAKIDNLLTDKYQDTNITDRRTGQFERRDFVRSNDAHSTLIGKASCGKEFDCAVVDFSLGGLNIETDADLQIGETVKIGTLNGVIVRKTENGYGVERQ